VHPSHLAHEFRAHRGTTVGEFVRQLRLEWAANVMLSEGASIADIALRAGFCDQSHFSRAFRRHFYATPAAWRREHT
jgi:AraC family transcriptional regulator